MPAAKVTFEALTACGFRELGVVTCDNRLILASGISPYDLPGHHGALVRQRFARGEIMLDPASPSAPSQTNV